MNSWLAVPLYLLVALPAALSDALSYRVPNWATLGGAALFLGLRVVFHPELWWLPPLDCAFGAGFFLLVRLATRGRLGWGDVKFGGFLGAALGWQAFLVSVAAACPPALAWGAWRQGKKRTEAPELRIPFVAFLAAGGLAGLAALLAGWA